MKSIISQIYNGEINPVHEVVAQCKEIKEINRRHYKQYEDFVSLLEPEQADEFEKIMDSQIETLPFEFAETFSQGFQLGALLMIEIFNSKYLKSTEK